MGGRWEDIIFYFFIILFIFRDFFKKWRVKLIVKGLQVRNRRATDALPRADAGMAWVGGLYLWATGSKKSVLAPKYSLEMLKYIPFAKIITKSDNKIKQYF